MAPEPVELFLNVKYYKEAVNFMYNVALRDHLKQGNLHIKIDLKWVEAFICGFVKFC